MRAQYFVNTSVSDGVPPLVTNVTLPSQGATGSGVVDRFTLSFSEDMAAGTVNAVGNFELRGAGADGGLDTADDILYGLSSDGYTSGLSAAYHITNGPLQPGAVRFTAGTGLTDRAGNPMAAAFVRSFTIAGVPGFIVENRDNDSRGSATSLSLTPGTQWDGSFTEAWSGGGGSSNYFIESGDFNADGHLDLVTANQGNSTVGVRLGRGNGTFQNVVNYSTGSNPIAVAVGDFNGDGKLDLVSSNQGSANVSVLLGNGNGTFGAATNFTVLNSPRSVAVGDLNADGKLDVAVANEGSAKVSVLLGTGTGSFQSAVHYTTGNSPQSVAVADFNADSKLDLVTANASSANVSVLLGTGTGTFGAAAQYGVGNSPRSVAAGDLSGDGKVDLAVVNAGDNTLSILAGNGNGTFGTAVNYPTNSSDPYRVVLADLDGDGDGDMAVPNWSGQQVSIFLNNGNGTFGVANNQPVSSPNSLVAGDFNEDGVLDLAVTSWSSVVRVLIGNRPQPLAEDPAGSGLRSGYGRGNLSGTYSAGNDTEDYWSFSGTAGDLVSMAAEAPGSPGGSSNGLVYNIYKPDGGYITGFASDRFTGRGESSPATLPVSGVYTLVVSRNYDYQGEYRFRVSTAAPPLQMETESNDAISNANVLTFAASGQINFGSTTGAIGRSGDLDYFNLGSVAAGKTIFLRARKPTVSNLDAVVSVYNSANSYVPEVSSGRPFDGVAQVPINQTGTYYAVMRSAGSLGDVSSEYVLDVQVATTGTFDFPNLQVTNVVLPQGAGFQSGQQIAFSYTVENVGSSSTQFSNWSDRIVMSLNTVLGDADDIPLSVYPHTGVLGPNGNYTVTQSAVLPSGISGDYYLIVETDTGNAINEFLLEGDNITVSTGTFNVILAPYPDLLVESLVVNGSAASGTLSVSWNTANRGTGSAAGPWKENVFVRNLTTNTVALNSDRTVTGSLGANATRADSATFPVASAGHYQVIVTVDSLEQVYEFNASGHTNAEQNNSAQTTIEATLDLQVAGLTVEPDTQLQSGNTVIIRWNDTNTGALSTAGSWNDRVIVNNTTTATTLLDTFVLYDPASNGAIGSGQSRARQYSFRLPDGPAGVGSLQVSVSGDANNNLVEYNAAGTAETNNGASIARTSTLAPYPDLVVSNIVAPASAWTDSAFDVTWRTTNQGTAPATGAWVDRVYLSVDQQLGSDVLLGTFPYTVGLAVGQNATRTQSVTIPRAGIANGNYHIIVVTDADNAVVEGANEGNNAGSGAQPIAVSVSPIPDLIVQTVEVPTTANSGQTIRVQWTVKNLGPGATNASQWHDQVFLSPDQTPDGSDDWRAETLNASYLNTGESYISAVDVKVPIGYSGNYYVIVKTDSRNAVLESNDGNNTALRAIPIQLTPPPDLRVSSVTSPQNGFSGQDLFVSWTVLNDGSGAVPPDQPSWSEAVYLSAAATLDVNTATLLGTFSRDGVLAQNASYTRQNQTVRLPLGISGTYYLFVFTDRGNQVYEHVNENNNSARATAPIQITLAPPPDLIVPTVSAGANGTAGLPISVSWTASNQGAGETVPGTWNDKVYLSGSATLNTSTATLLGTFTNGSSLEGGLSYNKTVNVTLPNCISGPFYVFVLTDADGSVFEYDPGFDANANNSGRTAAAVQVALTSPDLQVTAVTPPASGVAGQFITVGWTVRNAGIGETQVSTWRDRVYLSASGTFDAASAITLGTFQRNGSLPVNATYTQSQQFQIPVTAAGNYYVFVETDSGSEVVECTAEDNNRFRSAGVVNVASNAPDLVVSTVGIPATAESGRPITVTWTIANQGSGATPSASWRDTVYLSASEVLDTATAVLLGSKIHSGPVATGGNYSDSATFQLPNGITGQHYVFVVTDTDNATFEGREDNNSGRAATVVSITLSPSPDLRISSVAAPATGFAGQGITVTWTTTNSGNGATDVSQWSDYVYLSRDQILDPTDPSVGYAAHSGILVASGNYSASAAVSIPNGFSGPYFVFVTADRNNALYESDEANNSAYASTAVQVSIPPPADLIVTNVEVPATGSPGQPATIRWTVTNAGTNPATGTWTDSVYLSVDGTWDIGDALVGRFDHSASLAASGTYTQTSNVPLPGVVPGNYRVIVRTDIRNNVRESDEGNNLGVSSASVSMDVIELQLGMPFSSTLSTGTEHYFKVFVPANRVALFSLASSAGGAANELFGRYGALPNRGQYDALHRSPYSPNQEISLPTRNGGWLYILVRGDYEPQPQSPYIISVRLLDFEITRVEPSRGGNTGFASVTLEGAQFDPNATVTLSRPNTPPLSPESISVRAESNKIVALFNLTQLEAGFYDVTVINPSGASAIVPQGFRVTDGGQSNLSVVVLGPDSIPADRSATYFVTVSNNGDTDAFLPYLFIEIPRGSTWRIRPESARFISPMLSDGTRLDAATVPLSFDKGDLTYIALALPHVGQGTHVTLPVTVTPPSSANRLRVNAVVTSPIQDPYAPIELSGQPSEPFLSSDCGKALQSALLKSSLSLLGEILELDCLTGIANFAITIYEESIENDGVDALSGIGLVVSLSKIALDCSSAVIPFAKVVDVSLQVVEGGVEVYKAYRVCSAPKQGDKETQIARSFDPNELRGPTGYGAQRFVGTQQLLPYTIFFENVPSATAAAQEIRVTNPLDSDLDARSLRLREIVIGSTTITVPENRSYFQTRVTLGPEYGGVLADIAAGIDIGTANVVLVATAVDPNTGEKPQNPLFGLLLPNDETHSGEGHLTYTVSAKATAQTGSPILNSANIVFDSNEPIVTNIVENTLDALPPMSEVAALATVFETESFSVSWSGVDDANASGLKTFDVYVSEDDAEWTLWQSGVEYTTAPFTGQRGHAYRFYSVARDNAGNVETAPTTSDAATVISSGPNTPPVITPMANRIGVVGQLLQFQVVATDTDVPANTLIFSLEGGAPAGAAIDPATGLFTWTPAAGQAGQAYPITVRVTDNGTPVLDATRGFTVTVRTNQAPVAGADFLGTDQNKPVSVAARKLLLNDSDSDGDSLTLTLAGTTSIQGGSLSLANGSVTYSPLAAFTGNDTFTYTVSDGFGGSAQGAVTVTVRPASAPPSNPIALTPLANGRMQLNMVGIPGRSYVVQVSNNLTTWSTLTTMTAGANGEFRFEDADAANHPQRFYRLVLP